MQYVSLKKPSVSCLERQNEDGRVHVHRMTQALVHRDADPVAVGGKPPQQPPEMPRLVVMEMLDVQCHGRPGIPQQPLQVPGRSGKEPAVQPAPQAQRQGRGRRSDVAERKL